MFYHARLFGGRRQKFVVVLIFVMCAGLLASTATAQTLTHNMGGNLTGIGQIGSVTGGRISQMTFAPGDNAHLYVSTFGNGVWRFNYSQAGNLSGGVQVVPFATANSGGANGSLGIAFHQDTVNSKTFMYLSPAVPFQGDAGMHTLHTQSIVRLTDTNNNGVWGGGGDVNQAIVNNLQVSELHEVNQMQVRGNRLYVGVGSRTSTGGGDAGEAVTGETSYTGAVNFIDNLTLLSNTSTANLAGFVIANHQTDTQMFTSTDAGKLRVYSTGFRNNYGLATAANGDVWVSMNQGGATANTPDELHLTSFKSDHGFFKKNDQVGDWKTDVAATGAGYFSTTTPAQNPPEALLGAHAAAGGLDLITTNADLLNQIAVSQWVFNNVVLVDGSVVTEIASGFDRPLDVLTDPFGNLLVGENSVAGGVYRINVLNNVPEPASLALLGLSGLLVLRRRRRAA